MPAFEIDVPGDKKYKVEGPEGFTQEQAWQALFQQQYDSDPELIGFGKPTEKTQLGADVASLGRAAQALPGSTTKGVGDMWHALTNFDKVVENVKERGWGVFSDIKDDLAKHYGSIERARKTFEQDPFRFLTDVATGITGGAAVARQVMMAGAGLVRSTVPEIAARSGAFPEALTKGGKKALEMAGEAGEAGGQALEDYRTGLKAGTAGTAGGFEEAGAAIGGAPGGWVPQNIRDPLIGGAGFGMLGGIAGGTIPALATLPATAGAIALSSPRVAGASMRGAGAAQRYAGALPTTRLAIWTAAADLLKDRGANLSNDERKTLRAVARNKDTADSVAMTKAQQIINRVGKGDRPSIQSGPPALGTAQQYMGTGGDRSVASTQATAQTPSPGQASVPAQPPASAPGPGAAPQPLSEVPPIDTSQIPDLSELWQRLLKSGKISNAKNTTNRSKVLEEDKPRT